MHDRSGLAISFYLTDLTQNMTATISKPHQGRRSLQEILHAPGCLIASSVFDPVSARIAQDLGSEVGVLGGSIASHTVLGAPDIVLLTATELVEQARRICRTNCVNLIVDADHGYGNALNVMRTIQELQAAGVSAACVEDSVLPRTFGSSEAQSLVTMEEGVKKMQAAVEARGKGGPMLVVARTNAVASAGAAEAARRLCAYQDTGVDALFLPYLKRREELELVASAVSLPIIIGGSHESLHDRDYLASKGVKIWLWGHQTFAVAVQALYKAMKDIQDGVFPSQLKNKAPEQRMRQVLDSDRYDSLTQHYLE